MNKIPLTINGAQKLEEELKMLKAQRSVISESIATAREHGDLKENAEYHAAKDQQGLAEARIRDIESKLSNSEIIDVSIKGFGAGAGNTQMDIFLTVLEKIGYQTNER